MQNLSDWWCDMDILKTEPTLLEALDVFKKAIEYNLNCHKIGRIVSFNSERLTCDVRLLESIKFGNKILNKCLLVDMPLLINGSGNSNLTFGDPTGEDCVVHFNDSDIGNWFETGEEYLPPSKRNHDLSDGFITLRPKSIPKTFVYDLENTILGTDKNRIKINDTDISMLTETCSLKMDTLIELKNSTQSLALLVQALLTACENIQVGSDSSPISLTNTAKSSFTTVKNNFTELLK